VAASPVKLYYAQIAANQRTCQETLKAASSTSLQLRHVDIQGQQVICDISTGQPRPLIPVPVRKDVFRAVHELAHAGIRATRRLITARVVWRGMSSDGAGWCKECQLCAHGKASPQHKAPVQPIPTPERCFTNVHVDLVGLLPTLADGCRHLAERRTYFPAPAYSSPPSDPHPPSGPHVGRFQRGGRGRVYCPPSLSPLLGRDGKKGHESWSE
jgi:hypothetical protein